MIEIDVEPLRSIGLTQPVLQHLYRSLLESSCEPPLRLMRLTEVHRETVRLHDGRVERGARLLPRLARTLDEAGDAPAVGDWVVAGSDAHGDFWLHERLPPLTRLARRDADGRRHALVSNVDTALFMMGLDDDFNPRRLERYFALVHGSGMLAVVVLSKADVAAPAGVARALDALRGRVPAGVEVLAVDARSADTAPALAPWLGAGQTLVVLGSSGAGKSTLTNTLLGRSQQDTGAVREHDGRGKHTTTARSLHRLPGGACLIDTPGLRALRPDADAGGVAASFADIAGAGRALPLSRLPARRRAGLRGARRRAGGPAAQLPQAAARGAARQPDGAAAARAAGAVEGARARRSCAAEGQARRGLIPIRALQSRASAQAQPLSKTMRQTPGASWRQIEVKVAMRLPAGSWTGPLESASRARVEHLDGLGRPRERRDGAVVERLPGARHGVPAAQRARAGEEHGLGREEAGERGVIAIRHRPGEGAFGVAHRALERLRGRSRRRGRRRGGRAAGEQREDQQAGKRRQQAHGSPSQRGGRTI